MREQRALREAPCRVRAGGCRRRRPRQAKRAPRSGREGKPRHEQRNNNQRNGKNSKKGKQRGGQNAGGAKPMMPTPLLLRHLGRLRQRRAGKGRQPQSRCAAT
jgi:23S rRNA pseudouridine2605 synthase